MTSPFTTELPRAADLMRNVEGNVELDVGNKRWPNTRAAGVKRSAVRLAAGLGKNTDTSFFWASRHVLTGCSHHQLSLVF